MLLFFKAHVKTYTRKDGTVVKEHDDKRHAAGAKPSTSPKGGAKKLPGHWMDAHDHAVEASYAAWNHGEPHEDAIKSLKNSIKHHRAAAKAAVDAGDDDAAQLHLGKVKNHQRSIQQHEDHMKRSKGDG
jgi:hypothetical protein